MQVQAVRLQKRFSRGMPLPKEFHWKTLSSWICCDEHARLWKVRTLLLEQTAPQIQEKQIARRERFPNRKIITTDCILFGVWIIRRFHFMNASGELPIGTSCTICMNCKMAIRMARSLGRQFDYLECKLKTRIELLELSYSILVGFFETLSLHLGAQSS